MTAGPAPRRASRRRSRLVVVAIVAAVAVLYVTVVALYGFGSTITEDEHPAVGDAEAVITIRPQAVDAAANRLEVVLDLVLTDNAPTTDQISPDETVSVLVSASAGNRILEFPANQVLSPASVSLITDGSIETWPFDTHRVVTTLLVFRLDGDQAKVIPTIIAAQGRVSGWNFSASIVELPDAVVLNGHDEPVVALDIVASRAGSTVAFGLVLLALMVVVPIVVLAVAISVYRGRRRVEPSFLSWIGAMLFATIPMRTFLPGSPPIGSWIDFLIVLWVFVALIVGLVVYVLGWMRWSRPPETTATATAPTPGYAGPDVHQDLRDP